MRLSKYLALCGVASRRAAEKLIAGGVCEVNGGVVKEQGHIIQPGVDIVRVAGEIIAPERKKIYVMLNKPKDCVTTAKDQFGRPAVTDLVESDVRLYPVGRLDYDTSGLLLLTNDGDLAYKLTHPKFMIKKTYSARVDGLLSGEAADKLKKGVDIGGYVTRPAALEIVNRRDGRTDIKLTVAEGKNKQIKRMCEAVGYPVITLTRTEFGRLRLGKLREGEHRRLTAEELRILFEAVGADAASHSTDI